MSIADKQELKKVTAYFKNFTILCVEDEAMVRDAYKTLLGRLFKRVVFAVDGKDGLDKFANEDIDIIITDQTMPNMTGLEMITEIRKTDKKIPIVFVTAHNESELIKESLNQNVTHFLNKPIDKKKIINVFASAVKNCIADIVLMKEQTDKIEYSSMQEEMAFEKQLKIIKNDFCEDKNKNFFNVDIHFSPLDVLSGDSFSARIIDENRNLYFIVDGMGKGVSASTTAMISTSYLNHNLDKLNESNRYSLNRYVDDYLEFIKKYLLEDEIVAFCVVECNKKEKFLQIASFSMPRILILNRDNELIKLTKNNLPINVYMEEYTINRINLDSIKKMLISSDGLFENFTKDNKLFNHYIEEAFKNSQIKEEFLEIFRDKIEEQEDDVTFILLNNPS